MRWLLLFVLLVTGSTNSWCQELYISTEPASNMARNSIGVRLTNEGMFKKDFKSRTIPEVMYGASKNLMIHANAYFSDFYTKQQKFEGWGTYAKYRFFTIDSIQRHFRGAAFVRYTNINNPLVNDEINLEGDNSGLQGGLVFTQLLHKVALSGSVSYTNAFDNDNIKFPPSRADESIGYTFSLGYLAYPKVYTDYKQPNINLYVEFLGKNNLSPGKNIMDVAPAIQLILNSRLRLDLSQRFQLYGNMERTGKNMYLARLEYNFFNVF